MTIDRFTFLVVLLTAFVAFDLFEARHLRLEEWNSVVRKSVLSKVMLGAIVAAGFAAYALVFGAA